MELILFIISTILNESISKTIILLKVTIKITFLLTKKFKISSNLSLKAENLL